MIIIIIMMVIYGKSISINGINIEYFKNTIKIIIVVVVKEIVILQRCKFIIYTLLFISQNLSEVIYVKVILIIISINDFIHIDNNNSDVTINRDTKIILEVIHKIHRFLYCTFYLKILTYLFHVERIILLRILLLQF